MGNAASSYHGPSLKAKLGAIHSFYREKAGSYVQAEDIPELHLQKLHKKVLRKHYHQTLLAAKPDLFLDSMVSSIDNSVSMRRCLIPNDPHERELRLYPRIVGISRAQERFYDSLIFVSNLDPWAVGYAVYLLGVQHYSYFRSGFSPTFFDIWGSHMYEIASEVHFSDKQLFLEAFQELNSFIGGTMTLAFRRCKEDQKRRSFPSIRASSTSRISQEVPREDEESTKTGQLLPPVNFPHSFSNIEVSSGCPHSAYPSSNCLNKH